MKYLNRIFLFLVMLGSTSCTWLGLAAVNAPVSFAEMKVTHNVSYGPQAGQTLDIYSPGGNDGQHHPVIVFIYGGRWTTGSKKDFAFVAAPLVKRGYIVVIPDYSKYPQVRFPIFVEDGAKAVSWVDNHIAKQGGDRNRIFLMGHSAGAHIASLIVTDRHYLAAYNKTPAIIKAFAGLAGPYSFTPDEPDLIDMFGPPENYPKMQATNFITGHEPPMLLLRGDKDTDVEAYNADRLEMKIREKGGKVVKKTYPDVDHLWIIGAFSWAGRDKAPVVDDVTNFFKGITP